MNKMQKFRANVTGKFYGSQAVVLTGLMATPFFAMAAAPDPSAAIIAEIDKGKGYGIAAAVAFAVAVWAIRGVAMARRKG